jgi:hypothetical protein
LEPPLAPRKFNFCLLEDKSLVNKTLFFFFSSPESLTFTVLSQSVGRGDLPQENGNQNRSPDSSFIKRENLRIL